MRNLKGFLLDRSSGGGCQGRIISSLGREELPEWILHEVAIQGLGLWVLGLRGFQGLGI